MNVIEKADKYADGKANEAITKAIAQAYLDGYRDGYNDRDAEIPADFRDNKTKYIDLGLPSRTLWAEDYEKDGDNLLYLPYERAEYMKIPTIEQWNELITYCQWEIKWYSDSDPDIMQMKCIGPNGNILRFNNSGKIVADEVIDNYQIFFWIEDMGDSTEKNAVHIFNPQYTYKRKSHYKRIESMFSGYRLPIRLVR